MDIQHTEETLTKAIAQRLPPQQAKRFTAEAIAAAREGRLWWVDTQNRGADEFVIADSASEAEADVVEYIAPFADSSEEERERAKRDVSATNVRLATAEPETSGEDMPLPVAQIQRAWRLAHARGHHWASAWMESEMRREARAAGHLVSPQRDEDGHAIPDAPAVWASPDAEPGPEAVPYLFRFSRDPGEEPGGSWAQWESAWRDSARGWLPTREASQRELHAAADAAVYDGMVGGIWPPRMHDQPAEHTTGSGRLWWAVELDGATRLQVRRPCICKAAVARREALEQGADPWGTPEHDDDCPGYRVVIRAYAGPGTDVTVGQEGPTEARHWRVLGEALRVLEAV